MNQDHPTGEEKDKDIDSAARAKRRRESLSNLYESAIEAEKDTGRREKSPERAKRSLILRIVSIFFGTIITFLGLIMFITPGPGLLVLAAGLGILAIDVPFARNLLNTVKSKLPQDEAGRLSKQTIIVMIAMTTIGVALSAFSIYKTFG
jgi:uncharacterized protein (TIGR02611 family)